ncbi:MAG: hypothetical protein COV29_03330 [Candidatus Yanofskybacteria bacterium CG10_big_fil_rev_8_21_14_0_10_36_16]|uniref:CusB-like beta-barrel domain-containing protein n=1 Tax=Candidatus Yanofskybacteria bacterium CG10_big_fil_rev_8_21_14_0_10_36_16 TaxID=1975096 RepID=A0A2J0Q712_9BACT|nr:MAG: hypothetical protein COV29_03330 [Candidatus Yanofskybacteria bacterium CG10_big_fil_rev_8_21_14_0_10_36_16]
MSNKIKIGLIVAAAVIVAVVFVLSRGEKSPYQFVVASRGSVVQEVSVSGTVRPVQEVDLHFENSGRVESIKVDVGDNVSSGIVLASLDVTEISAQILEKEAALDSAEADLSQAIKNLNSLEDSTVATSLRTELENAESNLENVKKQAEDALAEVYNDGFNSMNNGMVQADSSFSIFKNIRITYFDGSDADSRSVQLAEDSAEIILYGADLYNRSGADDYVAAANLDDSSENVDTALGQLRVALSSLKSAYSVLQEVIKGNLSKVSSADRVSVSAEAAAVSSDLADVINVMHAIDSQKITNDKNISDAESKLASAESAFPTEEDILKKEASVKQAEANLLASRAQLNKRIVRAPFSGIVTAIEVEEGETITSNDIIISLISESNLQIETNVTEVDIPKVELEDKAEFTLDAYGRDVVFEAEVVAIDPAETIIEGVATYKVTLEFVDEQGMIRPGMTANIDIKSDRRDNVITVPLRAVIRRNGDQFVRLLHGVNLIEVGVKTGLRGSDGNIEIVSGVVEGDKVVTFIEE